MSAVVLLLIAVITVYFYMKYNNNKHLRKLASQLPGPPVLPLIGNGLAIKRTPGGVLYYLIEAQKKYGKVTRHWLGPSLYTVLTDPKDVEILLRDTKNLSKSQNYDFVKPWLGEGLITSTGNHWHTHRKVITPAFYFNILERFVEVFNEKGRVLQEILEKKTYQEEFDIYPYINLYALDAIMETAMGVKSGIQTAGDSNYVRAIHQITKIAHYRSFSFVHRSRLMFPYTKLGKNQQEVLDVIHGYCTKVIQQRKEELKNCPEKYDEYKIDDDLGKKKRLAFLDLLLLGQKDGSGFSDQDIREEVDTFMFAGHDTTTAAISFSIHYLAHYPDVQEKVYEEIKTLIGTEFKNLTLKDLQSFKYLDQVVKEVLRIAPPIPFISRRLESDLQINNYTLPAESAAAVFIYMLHRDPATYPDPEKFDPTRFNDENTLGRHPFAHVPFSAGPRNCIGQKYAQLEIRSTIIKLVRNFRLLPGSPIERLLPEVVLKSTNGIRVRLEKRN